MALMKNWIIFCILLTLLHSCGSTKNSLDTKATENFTNLIKDRSFEFTADWANPMATQGLNAISNAGLLPPGSNAGSIQINGTANLLKVKGDSVMANLPYYGERRFGGGYGSNTGIEFEGIPKNYTEDYDTDKQQYNISFLMDKKMENYNVNIFVFPNKTATVTVTSNQRNTIRYQGHVAKLEGPETP